MSVKKRYVLLFCIFCVVIILVSIYMYTFYQTKKNDLQTQIDGYTKQWDKKKEAQQKLTRLQNKIKVSATASASQNKSVIHTNSSSMLRFLDLSERLLQVRTEGFRVKNQAGGQYAYDISVYGTYPDLLLFMKNLDSFRTPYKLSGFDLGKKITLLSGTASLPSTMPKLGSKSEDITLVEDKTLPSDTTTEAAPPPSSPTNGNEWLIKQLFMEKMITSKEPIRFVFSISFQDVPGVPVIYPADNIRPLSRQTVKEMQRSRNAVTDLLASGSAIDLQASYVQKLFTQELEGK